MSGQIDDLIDEMLGFGMRFELAERVAPAILGLGNDPRGFRTALVEDCPRLAVRLGWTRLH